jgi:hypothetical protein
MIDVLAHVCPKVIGTHFLRSGSYQAFFDTPPFLKKSSTLGEETRFLRFWSFLHTFFRTFSKISCFFFNSSTVLPEKPGLEYPHFSENREKGDPNFKARLHGKWGLGPLLDHLFARPKTPENPQKP